IPPGFANCPGPLPASPSLQRSASGSSCGSEGPQVSKAAAPVATPHPQARTKAPQEVNSEILAFSASATKMWPLVELTPIPVGRSSRPAPPELASRSGRGTWNNFSGKVAADADETVINNKTPTNGNKRICFLTRPSVFIASPCLLRFPISQVDVVQ